VINHIELQIQKSSFNSAGASSCLFSGYDKGIYTPIFIAALFTIAKLWKQPRCPTSDQWIKKMWYLYTMEFYPAIKKDNILSFAGRWTKLENII
jgi:hypothetical protein